MPSRPSIRNSESRRRPEIRAAHRPATPTSRHAQSRTVRHPAESRQPLIIGVFRKRSYSTRGCRTGSHLSGYFFSGGDTRGAPSLNWEDRRLSSAITSPAGFLFSRISLQPPLAFEQRSGCVSRPLRRPPLSERGSVLHRRLPLIEKDDACRLTEALQPADMRRFTPPNL
jgi:hypothetical protein